MRIYNIAKAPLYYVRSGGISLDTNKLGSVGPSGYYWSFQPYVDVNVAYNLAFGEAGISPSSRNNRWRTYSLRWLEG